MADGGAYLVDLSNVFYISNGTLTVVHGLPSDVSILSSNLTGLADGSAVLVLSLAEPPEAYWLQKNQAKKIELTDAVAEGATAERPNSSGYYFAEASRLQHALNDVDTCEGDYRDEDDSRDVE